MVEAARDLLVANTLSAERGGRRYVFTVPSLRAYPFQWFWDSCFHAIVWARIDVERAREELRSLLAWQEPDGFIPHVVFWHPRRVWRAPFHWHYLESRGVRHCIPGFPKQKTSAHMQPPVLAQAVEHVALASENGDFVEEALPAVESYYRWLATARDPDGDGLVSIISQFESGLDYSPLYDASVGIVRPNLVSLGCRPRWPELQNKLVHGYDLERIFRRGRYHQEDVLVNSVYCDGLRALARLAPSCGETGLAAWASAQADRVLAALVERCWDPAAGLFVNLVGGDERATTARTVVSLMPLILEGLPAPIVASLVDRLTTPGEFWADYPVPSVALDEPTFTRRSRVGGRRFIWRGPLSMNLNWFLARGLRVHGEDDAADAIATSSRDLVRRHGFNEFYDPITGEPVGVERFGWATLAVDM